MDRQDFLPPSELYKSAGEEKRRNQHKTLFNKQHYCKCADCTKEYHEYSKCGGKGTGKGHLPYQQKAIARRMEKATRPSGVRGRDGERVHRKRESVTARWCTRDGESDADGDPRELIRDWQETIYEYGCVEDAVDHLCDLGDEDDQDQGEKSDEKEFELLRCEDHIEAFDDDEYYIVASDEVKNCECGGF